MKNSKMVDVESLTFKRERAVLIVTNSDGDECCIQGLQIMMPDDVFVYCEDPRFQEVDFALKGVDLRTGLIGNKPYTSKSVYNTPVDTYVNLIMLGSLIRMFTFAVNEYNTGVEYGSTGYRYFQGASKHYAPAQKETCQSACNSMSYSLLVSAHNKVIVDIECGEVRFTNFFMYSPYSITSITKGGKGSIGYSNFKFVTEYTSLRNETFIDGYGEILDSYRELPILNNLLDNYVTREGLDMVINISSLSGMQDAIQQLTDGFQTTDEMIKTLS